MTSPACSVLLALAVAAGQVAASRGDEPLVFNRDIRPILSENCFKCHGPDSAARKAELRLDRREAALEQGAIVPGDPDQSELVTRIFSGDDEIRMPPADSHKSLTELQKERLRRWIAEGAVYQAHWSFIPLAASVPIPRPDASDRWVRTPIDAFVLDRLRRARIEPAVEASREKWLRRAAFDLTGLPPTLEELDRFAADPSPDAYEQVAERLLAAGAFGERMAGDWLDVARYADTFGYQSDRDMHVWPWRDWVVRAFNANLSYRDFIVWQTAGDWLDPSTATPAPRDRVLATAFNRLHRQTNEGGSIEEEFRAAYVSDRVQTNGTAWLGLTLECARCHDHKYDPVTQKEYYQFSAFFDNIDEHGLYSHFTETAPTPTLLLYEGDQEPRHRELLAKIRESEASLAQTRAEAQPRYQAWLQSSPPPIERPKPDAEFNFETAQPQGENKPVAGKVGQAYQFGGDEAFVCKGAGAFGRATAFSFALWVKPAEQKPRMIVLHRSAAAEDAAFRGYSLTLDDGHPVFSMAHFWPGNAIQVRSAASVPNGEWTHLVVTYDGTSRAAGVKMYLGGAPLALEVVRDRLTRDITYRAEWGDSSAGSVELGLGARFRDVGFKDGAIDELEVFNGELTALEALLVGGFTPGGTVPAATAEEEEERFAHYLARHDPAYQQARAALTALRQQENELVGQVRQIMAMAELPWRRPTYVLRRGAYDARGERVEPGTPAGVFPFPAEYPRNRLGLAQWIVDERNPLTARVAVNRFWQIFFGHGLVATPEDFGGQGQPPTHPELLDWLARHFIDSGWDVKALAKLIVLSSTYRQSSSPRDTRLFADDPDNRLLARGPRHRLSAEQIRDNALSVSGLLVQRIGGPSVRPYQPAGLWEESGTGKSYTQDHGEGLYRRSLYTFWRRTSPPPGMLSFDAVSREVCTARRERTATPLQALVLLNDPQFVEAARVLAEKLIHEHAAEVERRLRAAFRLLTSREPTADETKVLVTLYAEQRADFALAPGSAKAFLDTGEAPRDQRLDLADHAATAAVVLALLNFDECVTKR
ncbi:MAG TPA: DUF1553 domain-containing protein [Pirellulales bacterium]|nr:DUF1553 domain-containing protein [Pirellulales bacterium]